MATRIALLMPCDDTRDMFFSQNEFQALEKIGKVTYNHQDKYDRSHVARMLDTADICVSGWGCPPFTESILSGAKDLRLVVHTGGSVAPIVTPELYQRGITVISANELYAESVAEGTIAYMLAGLRRIPFYNSYVRQGNWLVKGPGSEGLLDQHVGLVGFGSVAKNLIPMLKAFRVKVHVYDPFAPAQQFEAYQVIQETSLETMVEVCRIISLHAPKTPETHHIFNERILSHMQDGALLVNSARGSLIDEEALIRELENKRIRAVLDVFEQEPPPETSKLRQLENVILIPHMAGPTRDRYFQVTLSLMEDIQRFINHEPLLYGIAQERAVRMTNDFS